MKQHTICRGKRNEIITEFTVMMIIDDTDRDCIPHSPTPESSRCSVLTTASMQNTR